MLLVAVEVATVPVTEGLISTVMGLLGSILILMVLAVPVVSAALVIEV